MSGHRGKRTEWMWCRWLAPEPAEQAGDDDILFELWQLAERRARFAPLQQHRVEVGIEFEQPHGRVTIPEAEGLELVRRFHMRHTEFQHGASAVATHGGRHPRAAPIAAVEGGPQRQGPPVLQLA